MHMYIRTNKVQLQHFQALPQAFHISFLGLAENVKHCAFKMHLELTQSVVCRASNKLMQYKCTLLQVTYCSTKENIKIQLF